MKKIIGIAVALIIAMILSATPVMAAQNQALCFVDIGNENSEAGHDMDGWGSSEPDANGGNWGGFDTSGEDCRVIWDVESDDPSATITLNRCCKNGSAKAIILRHLDGTADDSFIVEVKNNRGKWVEIGSYEDVPDASDPEEWYVTTFKLPNGRKLQLGRGLEVEVKITATGEKWASFDTYGQVAFDWIELDGNGGCGDCDGCGQNFRWNWRWGFNWMKNFGNKWFR